MINAVGHFKRTKLAAYGEAVINIGLSLVLVSALGLAGVAIAMLVATTFRMICYAWYLSRNVIFRSFRLFIKRQMISLATFGSIAAVGIWIFSFIEVQNFLVWILCAVPTAITAALITLIVNYIFYKDDMKSIFSKFI